MAVRVAEVQKSHVFTFMYSEKMQAQSEEWGGDPLSTSPGLPRRFTYGRNNSPVSASPTRRATDPRWRAIKPMVDTGLRMNTISQEEGESAAAAESERREDVVVI